TNTCIYRSHVREGFEIFKVRGLDYHGLCEAYEEATKIAREEHIPCIVHVTELSQPQGHSSSGSHERYKSQERLEWEHEYDCNKQMRSWLLDAGLATEEELVVIEQEAKDFVKSEQRRAWSDYRKTIQVDLDEAIQMLEQFEQEDVKLSLRTLQSISEPSLKEIYSTIRLVLRELRFDNSPAKVQLSEWYKTRQEINIYRYNDNLTSAFDTETLNLSIEPEYGENPKTVDGREVLNACFEANFRQNDRLLAFGEDVGKIGD